MTGNFGYAGKILRVDLSSGNTSDIDTAGYADKFLGGRGIAAKIYWNEVPPDTRAFDPENRLLFLTGPLTGVAGLASSRVQVCGKSPVTTPEHFCYANLGGSWGPYLKFAGYDGVVVQEKSDKPVYLFLHDGICEIRDASHFWGEGAIKVREMLKDELGSATKVIATGTAGDNMVIYASLLADNDACGAGGFGAVMGSKRLKAIAVSGSRKVAVATPQKLRELTRYILELKRGPTKQPQAPPANRKMKWEVCWGCIGGCARATYKADNGQQGKFMCQPSSFSQSLASKYYGELNDVPFRVAKLCDDNGLDTKAIEPMITWLSRCEQAGILTDKETGIPISKLGSLEFIETLVQKISHRDGFGDILAQGTIRAADLIGGGAAEQITDVPFQAENQIATDPRLYITTGLLHMAEPRTMISEMREIGGLVFRWREWLKNEEGSHLTSEVFRAIAQKFFGSKLAADFSIYEEKALAAKIIQDREYAKECLILCGHFWPMMYLEYSENRVGDSSIESKLVSAITGEELDENELYRLGERVFNLERAILIREGHQGRESDTLAELYYTIPLETDIRNPECIVPGKDGQAITKKGTVLDREKFERLKDEYYELRGWDIASGRQTKAKLEELELGDIAEGLMQRGLLA